MFLVNGFLDLTISIVCLKNNRNTLYKFLQGKFNEQFTSEKVKVRLRKDQIYHWMRHKLKWTLALRVVIYSQLEIHKQLTSLGRYSVDIISIKVLQQFQVGYWDIASTHEEMKSQHISFSWFSNLRYPPSDNISVKSWRSAPSQGINQWNNLYICHARQRIFAYDVIRGYALMTSASWCCVRVIWNKNKFLDRTD